MGKIRSITLTTRGLKSQKKETLDKTQQKKKTKDQKKTIVSPLGSKKKKIYKKWDSNG